MTEKIRCRCPRCTIRSLIGPAVIITFGVILFFQQIHGFMAFWKLTPVVLIVIGILLLASALAPMDGHIYASVPTSGAPGMPATAPQAPQNAMPPTQGQGQ